MPAIRVRSLHCPDEKGKLDKMTDAKTCDCGETAGTDLIGAMKISQLSSWTGISIVDTTYLPSKGTSARFLSDKFGRPTRACLYCVHFYQSLLTNLHETPRPASLECTPS